jgi:hypothetical protein
VPTFATRAACRRSCRRGPAGERPHARWRRRSGPLAPSVNGRITMNDGAISTTGRRPTTRPCNLSPLVTQPASLRCALTWPGRGHSPPTTPSAEVGDTTDGCWRHTCGSTQPANRTNRPARRRAATNVRKDSTNAQIDKSSRGLLDGGSLAIGCSQHQPKRRRLSWSGCSISRPHDDFAAAAIGSRSNVLGHGPSHMTTTVLRCDLASLPVAQ